MTSVKRGVCLVQNIRAIKIVAIYGAKRAVAHYRISSGTDSREFFALPPVRRSAFNEEPFAEQTFAGRSQIYRTSFKAESSRSVGSMFAFTFAHGQGRLLPSAKRPT